MCESSWQRRSSVYGRVSAPDPLAPLRGQFPRWEAWRGIGGLLYARLRKSSPPVVFHDLTGEGLAAQIREWENSRR